MDFLRFGVEKEGRSPSHRTATAWLTMAGFCVTSHCRSLQRQGARRGKSHRSTEGRALGALQASAGQDHQCCREQGGSGVRPILSTPSQHSRPSRSNAEAGAAEAVEDTIAIPILTQLANKATISFLLSLASTSHSCLICFLASLSPASQAAMPSPMFDELESCKDLMA